MLYIFGFILGMVLAAAVLAGCIAAYDYWLVSNLKLDLLRWWTIRHERKSWKETKQYINSIKEK